MNNSLKKSLRTVSTTVLMVVIALIFGAILIALSGNDIGEAYGSLLRGAFSSLQKITELFVKLIPVLMMSLGVSIAYKAQLWNIGAQGQFTMSAVVAVACALYIPLPLPLRMVISLIASVTAGGLWAALAGWLKTKFNANEVITTLMLNYVASYFLLYLINGPMQDPYSDLAQSDIIPEGMRLTRLFGEYRLHTGIFFLIIVVIFMIVFWKTTLGYKVDLIGQGEKVATYSGINVNRTIITTMAISGAIIGLAGWLEIYGIQYRLFDGLAADLGNTATIIALLGSLNVYGIIAAAAFFSVLLVGGASMQRMTDVPYSVVDVMQGLIIIFIIAKDRLNQKIVEITKNRKIKKEIKSQGKEC